MDLRVYYQRLRQLEAALPEGDVVVVSEETPDGGRAGVRLDVSRASAAKLILEKRARLASAEESEEYRRQVAEAKRAAEQATTASRVQIAVLSDSDVKALKSAGRGKTQ